jgi:hypothetical protein
VLSQLSGRKGHLGFNLRWRGEGERERGERRESEVVEHAIGDQGSEPEIGLISTSFSHGEVLGKQAKLDNQKQFIY